MYQKKHKEQFEVLFYHLDRNGFASIKSIVNFLQATTTKHGRLLEANIEDLSDKNLTWVFSRFHIKIFKYPKQFDIINCTTWRSGSKGCFAFREYEGFDENNDLFCSATASAALIDLHTRKPVEIPEFIQNQFAPEYGRAIHDNFEKLHKLENADNIKEFSVRMGDIDLNNHVNNSSYFEWIIECVPEKVLLNYKIIEIEINYQAEVFYGESIVSHTSLVNHDDDNNIIYHHKLNRKEDGKTIALARTIWEEYRYR